MMTRARERRIAEEIARELHRAIGNLMPESLPAHGDVVRSTFGDAFDRHHIVDETVAARILARVPRTLARLNLKFAELNAQLDAAVHVVPKFRIEREFIQPNAADDALSEVRSLRRTLDEVAQREKDSLAEISIGVLRRPTA
jgi:hypothetical protein